MRRERGIQRQLARELPRQMARMIGAPVAMPSHVGDVEFDAPMLPGARWRTRWWGRPRSSSATARSSPASPTRTAPGHIGAEVTLADPEPLDPVPDRFWIPIMPASVHAVWHPSTCHGAVNYRVRHALGRHPWQSGPAADLPDRIEAHDPAEAPQARG